MITKKDIARQKAKEKYSKEITKLAEDISKRVNHHVSQLMTRFYNKALRIAEKNVLAFQENYEDLKNGRD